MSDIFLMVFKAIVFILVFACILFIAYVTTRYIGKKTGKTMSGKYINLVESVSLGIDKQLHLLKVGEEFVLVASAGKSVEFLTTLKLEGYEESGELENNNTTFDFKEFFDKYLNTFKVKTDKRHQGESLEKSEGDFSFKRNLDKLKEIVNKTDRESG